MDNTTRSEIDARFSTAYDMFGKNSPGVLALNAALNQLDNELNRYQQVLNYKYSSDETIAVAKQKILDLTKAAEAASIAALNSVPDPDDSDSEPVYDTRIDFELDSDSDF